MALKKYQGGAINKFNYLTMVSGGVTGKYLNSNGAAIESSNWSITDYIPCNGTTFTLYPIGGNAPAICLYNSNKQLLVAKSYNSGGSETKIPVTITSSSIANYARFSYYSGGGGDDLSQIMLVEGSTVPSEYHPYYEWNDIPYRRYETATDAVTNLPVTVYGDGETDISLLLKGNTETSGTPSPQNPVTIQGVGEETANLLNPSTLANGYSIASDTGLPVESAQRIATLTPINVPQGTTYIKVTYNSDNVTFMYSTFRNDTLIERVTSKFSGSVLTLDNVDKIYISWYKSATTVTTSDVTDIMVSIGSEVVPYEPYGYKISISSNGTPLTPMYFSQQLFKFGDTTDDYSSSGTATYKICKKVFTGQEAWEKGTSAGNVNRYNPDPNISDGVPLTVATSTHFKWAGFSASSANDGEMTGTSSSGNYRIWLWSTISTVTDFKQFLADQYAAGTPVTVYYVLATATTESVTAPTITTTGGEVSIDVDTTVKPSEVDLTYHGWHSHEPLKRENGAWT